MSYTIASPIPDKINTGIAEQALQSLGQKFVWKDGSDVVHIAACFGGSPSNFYCHYVNTTDEDSGQLFMGGLGTARSGAYNSYYNKFYIGGASFCEIDLNNSPPTFSIIVDNLGSTVQYLGVGVTIGTDNRVYYVDYVNAKIYGYDPSLGYPSGWVNYGTPMAGAGNYEYCSIRIDANYIYFTGPLYGTNTPTELFYCAINDPGNWQPWTYNGSGDISVYLLTISGTANWFVKRRDSGGTYYYYLPNGATYTVTTPQSEAPGYDAPAYCWAAEDEADYHWFYDAYGWEPIFDGLCPIKVVWEKSTLQWWDKVGDPEVNTKISTKVFLGTSFPDNTATAALALSGKHVMILGSGYSAAVDYNYNTSSTDYLGAQVLSGYELDIHPLGDVFGGGYSNKVWRYDPDSSWTMVPSITHYYDPGDIGKPNPYFINLGARTLHYRTMFDFTSNGLVWIGGNTTRLSPNYGDVMWYDPDDGSSAYMFQTLWGDTKRCTCVCCSGNLVCVGDEDSKIWVIDGSTSPPTLDETPVTVTSTEGTRQNVFLGLVSTDLMLGVVQCTTSPSKVFTFQPSTKTVLSSADIVVSGNPFGWDDAEISRRRFKLVIGPDGFGWMFFGTVLYRIDSSDLSFYSVKDYGLYGRIVFANNYNDLIIYGWDENIYAVNDLFSFSSYSRGYYADLPTADADLDTPYTGDDITDVAADDTDMVAQSATSQIAIHQFKQQINGTGGIINVVAQVTIPCSTSTAYLQIYNRSGTPAWDTIDSDNATGANTDFTLSATVADLTDYKDENNIVACRVYQEMQ